MLYRLHKRYLEGKDYDLFPVSDLRATAIVEAVEERGPAWMRSWSSDVGKLGDSGCWPLRVFLEGLADVLEVQDET